MPYEDVGTTRRQRISGKRVLALWEAHRGICVTCERPIDGVREKWFVEHRTALELGGTNDDANLGPAHWSCKNTKDAADHSAAAQAKRRKREQIGIGNRKGPRLQGQGFRPAEPQRKASKPLEKKLPPRINPWVKS